jgi:GAF domain-containing protein
MESLRSWLQDLISPEEAALEVGAAPPWRTQALQGILLTAAVLGLPAVVSGGLEALRAQQIARLVIYLIVWGAVVVLALGRHVLPFAVRAGGVLAAAYLLSIQALLTDSLPGNGRVFLFAFSVLGVLMFGLRGGFVAWAVGLASMAAIAWGQISGVLPSAAAGASSDTATWITAGLVLALVSMMFIIGLAILQRGLETSESREQQMAAILKDERERLQGELAARERGVERRARQLQTAAEIAKLAAEADDPRLVAEQAVERIRDRFGFYHASVFTLDDTGSWADVAASTGEAGRQLLARRHRLAVGSASIVGWVTGNRMPRVSNDVSRDPFHYKNPLLPETRSEMAVPLLAGDRLLGVLDVQSQEPEAFSEDDLRAVEAIGNELAFAIDNARRVRETQEEFQKVDGLYRGRVRESWARFARAGVPTLLRVGGDGSQGPSLMGEEASRSGRTVLSADGREVGVPVLVRGDVVATISARRRPDEPAWSTDDVAVLESVSGQIGLSLENARQYTEEQRRVSELEVVNRISQGVSQLLRLDSLFRVVHAQVDQILPGVDVSIGLYHPAQDSVEYPFVAEGGEIGQRPASPLGQDLASHVLRNRQPLLLAEDLPAQAVLLGLSVPHPPPACWLGVPMLVGDSALGLLVVQDPGQERRFTEDDVALLTTVASQVATAIQNDRLLDQTQRAARRERLIHEITSKVRRSPDIRTILDTTAREIGRALNASRASVRLGPADSPSAPSAPASDSPPPSPSEEGSR